MLDVVEAGGNVPAERGDLGAVVGIGPGVTDDVDACRPHPSAGVASEGDPMTQAAAVRAGDEMLTATLEPLHRAAQLPRRGTHHDVLGVEHALHPEPTSDVRHEDPEPVFVDPEVAGEPGAETMRVLMADVDGEALTVGHGEDRERLDRVGDDPAVDDLDGRLDVDGRRSSFGGQLPALDDVGAGGLVEDDVASQRLLDRGHHRERVEIGKHHRGAVLCGRGTLCDDHGHRLSGEADPVRRQGGAVHVLDRGERIRPRDRWGGEVGRDEDVEDPGHLRGERRVDAAHDRVRLGAPGEGGMEDGAFDIAADGEIVDVTAGTGDEALVLDPRLGSRRNGGGGGLGHGR